MCVAWGGVRVVLMQTANRIPDIPVQLSSYSASGVVASFPGQRVERRIGPGDTWQIPRMC